MITRPPIRLRPKVAPRPLAWRDALCDTPYYRLIHAEADGMPGTVVDRFGDALVIQPNAAWIDTLLPEFMDVLSDVTGASVVVKNAQGRARALEGLDDVSQVQRGALDGLCLRPGPAIGVEAEKDDLRLKIEGFQCRHGCFLKAPR